MVKEFVVAFRGELDSFSPRYFDTLEEAQAFFSMAQGKLVNPELVELMRVVPLAA
jgi:hypothetical protein